MAATQHHYSLLANVEDGVLDNNVAFCHRTGVNNLLGHSQKSLLGECRCQHTQDENGLKDGNCEIFRLKTTASTSNCSGVNRASVTDLHDGS